MLSYRRAAGHGQRGVAGRQAAARAARVRARAGAVRRRRARLRRRPAARAHIHGGWLVDAGSALAAGYQRSVMVRDWTAGRSRRLARCPNGAGPRLPLGVKGFVRN